MFNNVVCFLRIFLAILLMITWEVFVAVLIGIETGVRWYVKLWQLIIRDLKEDPR